MSVLTDTRKAICSTDRLFHRPGLVYLWFLNGSMDYPALQSQLDAFAEARISALVLHPRGGLTLPYGGDEWFERIRWICDRCAERDLHVWLYDEDPHPSGAAGGRLTAEHPEFIGYRIERHLADEGLAVDENFCFPAGRLLWCGWVDTKDGRTIDLTSRVGMIRRDWIVLNPWDSRNYYPETPLYTCPRAMTVGEEYALRINQRHQHMRLMAFVARPATQARGDAQWSAVPDRLRPAATLRFLEMTHEQYRARMGEQFGRGIRAIFTDEAKFHASHPFTPGMLEDFQRQYGYDLRPRLDHLFDVPASDVAATTRLHYRQWCARRFEQAWVEPVSRWCKEHGLPLVGHLSPEDDPIQQAELLGNLLPLMRHFTIPGIDLIVPAVGDHRHPLLNLGVIAASSVAQQTNKPGVLSESLACSCVGEDMPLEQIRRILFWQAMMGVTTHVIHAAYLSMEGNRAIDAPPDLGPNSGYWPGMMQTAKELVPIQGTIRDTRQIAPVAIVWPIRTYQMLQLDWQDDPLRRRFVSFVAACLDRQIGIHFIDESTLWQTSIEEGELKLGRTSYSHVVVVAAKVLHERTVQKLAEFCHCEGRAFFVDEWPDCVQTSKGVEAMQRSWAAATPSEVVLSALPRLVALQGNTRDVRCTLWERDGQRTLLLMNLTSENKKVQIDEQWLDLPAGVVIRHAR